MPNLPIFIASVNVGSNYVETGEAILTSNLAHRMSIARRCA